MRVSRLPEFDDWIGSLDLKGRVQVDARILRIQDEDYFGDAKYLGDGLAELRWKSGRRVYFSRVRDEVGGLVLIILGGTKNGQSKDIAKARILLRRYAGVKT